MKKLFLSLIVAACLFVFSNDVLAQSGFYVQPGLTYHMPVTQDILGISVTNLIDSDGNYTPGDITQTNIYGSYGGGLGLDLELGYFFNKHIAANLGLSYVLGKETKTESFSGINALDVSVAKNKRFTLSPGVTVDGGLDKFSPFARFGLLIPVAGQTKGNRTSDNCLMTLGGQTLICGGFGDFQSFDANSIAKGQFSVGFTSSVGARYKLSDMISVFASLSYTGLRIRRKTYEVTDASITANGEKIDAIPLLGLGGAYEYTEYVDEITPAEEAILQAMPDYGTKSNPAHELAIDANFSTFGINVGARFTFGSGYE